MLPTYFISFFTLSSVLAGSIGYKRKNDIANQTKFRTFPMTPYLAFTTLESVHIAKNKANQTTFFAVRKTRLVNKSRHTTAAPNMATTAKTKEFTNCVSQRANGSKTRVKTAAMKAVR
jgi:hypothetical protein